MGYNYIIAIDPGGTTGVAKCRVKSGMVSHLSVRQERDCGRLTLDQWNCDWKSAAGLVIAMVEQYRPDALVVESFQLRTKHATLSPVQINSVIDYEVPRIGVPVVWQAPSERSVMTDQRLRSWGLWLPGKPHAMDALRHLLVYARKINKM